MGKKGKRTLVKEEKERLLAMLAEVAERTLQANMCLVDRAAYLTVTARELEVQIDVEGSTSEYNNGGGQKGDKISASAQVHSQTVKNLMSVMRQLNALAAKCTSTESDELLDFEREYGD
ncbi:MAG: hypothetical protein LBU07_05060 [Coriobacteriales bacterium]|jgi:phage I-like protein|nr:hypothetical protein [Coriobacteriales bacterium]